MKFSKLKRVLQAIFLTHLGRILYLGAPLLVIGGTFAPDGILGSMLNYSCDFCAVLTTGMLYTGMAILVFQGMFIIFSGFYNSVDVYMKSKKNKK